MTGAGTLTGTHRARRTQVIGVASGLGARDKGCAAAPGHLLDSGLVQRLRQCGADVALRTLLHPRPHRPAMRYRAIGELCTRIAREVGAVLDEKQFAVVLGGDHSCAIGTWSGVAQRLAREGTLGLVWIDAHMDSHTPATSHSGMPHGMPLAALLGHGGDPRVAGEVAAIATDGQVSPSHTCLVGVRSYQHEEAALLERLGVRIFAMDEIHARGMAPVLAEAIDLARGASAGYGLSIDVDAIDPRDAPGVGTPEAGGIEASALLHGLAAFAGDPRLAALEIVEYNPHRDVGERTAELIEELVATVLGVVYRADHAARGPYEATG